MNVAAMGLIYGNAVKTNKKYQSKSDRYICWAKGQMRYVLGDVVTGFVVGFPSGGGGYNRPQDRASSCPAAPAVCNAITAYYNPQVRGPPVSCCRLCYAQDTPSQTNPVCQDDSWTLLTHSWSLEIPVEFLVEVIRPRITLLFMLLT